jgi:hypothetical protein
MEPKEEPAPLHIRVVQRLQPSKALTVNLGILSARTIWISYGRPTSLKPGVGKDRNNDAVYDLAKFAVRFISQ